ncbi:MAG: hypothetical protein A2V85_02845 [Chloroflexi bacterium RBG_16_72_14]|nr:MAG: hypothetical protein A2V85_02845 [Chloroflexi bacterium RBG_16_72_14]
MNCPYCEVEGGRRDIHAHLWAAHPDLVRTFRDEVKGTLKFALDCPFCDEGLERVANPRGREPGFLEEFRREIALVSFDLLLYHLQASHAERVGLQPIAVEEPATGGTP